MHNPGRRAQRGFRGHPANKNRLPQDAGLQHPPHPPPRHFPISKKMLTFAHNI